MRKKTYTVDLANIEGEGDFPCPKCGTKISPDDETEEVYTVIDSIIGEDDAVESLTIQCKKCNSIINLEGLSALSAEGEEARVKVSEPLPDSKPGAITNHTLELDGKPYGRTTIEYASAEDVSAFKKARTLHEGDGFKATINIENAEGAEPSKKDMLEVAKTVKRKFKGLRDSDIYFVDTRDGKKNFIGRASNIVVEEA